MINTDSVASGITTNENGYNFVTEHVYLHPKLREAEFRWNVIRTSAYPSEVREDT
jgi:hypothetical protein